MIRLVLAAVALATLTACTPSAAAPAASPAAHAEPAPAAPAAPAAPTAPTEQHVAAQAQAGCHVVDGRADSRCTPGVRNPQVTQINTDVTICAKDWTVTIRPPVSYTDDLKRKGLAQYGEPGPLSLYEEDHLIPLELGGSPTDPGNLWPQPYAGPAGAKEKDHEEDGLRAAVCNGRMKLADAQAQILAHWTHP